MDLSFDEGQELFKRSARQFMDTYCEKAVVADLEASETGFSESLWKGMAELGWMGVVVPSDYDGLESSLLELAVLFEEMGRAAMPSPFLETVMGTLMACLGPRWAVLRPTVTQDTWLTMRTSASRSPTL